MDFPRNSGMIASREEITMTRRPRRNHSPAFKAKVTTDFCADLVVIYCIRSEILRRCNTTDMEGGKQ